MGLVYENGVKVFPKIDSLKQTVLVKASRLKIISLRNGVLKWIPLNNFDLTKIPLEVREITREYIYPHEKEIIGYQLNLPRFFEEKEKPISTLYFPKDSMVEERQSKEFILSSEEKFKSAFIVFDNFYPSLVINPSYDKMSIRARLTKKQMDNNQMSILGWNEYPGYQRLQEHYQDMYDYFFDSNSCIHDPKVPLEKAKSLKKIKFVV